MSRVVHLSDKTHQQAKEYCHKHGVRMSDWVGALIVAAIQEKKPRMDPVEDPPSASVQIPSTAKKKPLPKIEDQPQRTENGLPLYSAPPFWATGNR